MFACVSLLTLTQVDRPVGVGVVLITVWSRWGNNPLPSMVFRYAQSSTY